MASLSSKIKAHLGREVNFRTEVVLVDNSDGQGPRISEWNAPEPQPTEAELSAAEASANSAESLSATILSRKIAYGTVGDQLDMMYWDEVNGTTVWKDFVAHVKAANPK